MADPCGTSGATRFGDCPNAGTHGWQRRATRAEVDHYHQTGDLPAYLDDADVPVTVCAEHELDPDVMALTHDATCQQPAPGEGHECGACAGP